MNSIEFNIRPMGAIRMNHSDVKLLRIPRHAVLTDRLKRYDRCKEYQQYKTALKLLALSKGFKMPSGGMSVFFFIKPTPGMSKKKERQHDMPHQVKPDLDNLLKALFDALCTNDSHIWQCNARKLWGKEDKILITWHNN